MPSHAKKADRSVTPRHLEKYCAPTKHDANGETLGIVPDPQKDPAEIFKRDIGEVQLNVADDLLRKSLSTAPPYYASAESVRTARCKDG